MSKLIYVITVAYQETKGANAKSAGYHAGHETNRSHAVKPPLRRKSPCRYAALMALGRPRSPDAVGTTQKTSTDPLSPRRFPSSAATCVWWCGDGCCSCRRAIAHSAGLVQSVRSAHAQAWPPWSFLADERPHHCHRRPGLGWARPPIGVGLTQMTAAVHCHSRRSSLAIDNLCVAGVEPGLRLAASHYYPFHWSVNPFKPLASAVLFSGPTLAIAWLSLSPHLPPAPPICAVTDAHV